MISIYFGKKIEFRAGENSIICKLDKPGLYEIAYKKPAIFGTIPTHIAFQMHRQPDGKEILVSRRVNVFGSRKDMSGNRIVPVAEFTIDVPGDYRLLIPEIQGGKDRDKLIIKEKTGLKGFLMIFAILFSAIATIAGLVLSILAFLNKI
ncbi:hypothetical protein [Dyadobacter pollutisoli]|uniref:Uncharacterized protein n=1 Tax=Dyadobacter pollutisoli TaxID=2910158 RepID=A0A9E8SNH7_9BACT|nr:hypothetical protein [Dyadobacter pollutisoli]WAC13741.1 hypothetical protein ON006_07225 [Dyadobacter pollutisoli]